MKIGVFDSGLGGILILNALKNLLPKYDYEFYGDTNSLPLGDKNEEEIYELTKIGVEHLFKKNCLIVIIACNTASAQTLRKIQQDFLPSRHIDRKVLGVIVPTVEEVIDSKLGNFLLIGTKRTIDSKKYEIEFRNRTERSIKLISRATPELVPFLEEGQIVESLKVAQSVVNDTETEVGEVDGLILGCTHYSLLKNELRETYKNKKIFSQDELIPRKIKNYFERHSEIEKKLTRNSTRNIYLTLHREDYDNTLRELL